jgi:hypothetical protein
MAEKPLFQNADEQEAVFAPQETADDGQTERVLAEEGTTRENRAAGSAHQGTALPIPGPGVSGALNNMGNISSGTASPIGAIDSDDDDHIRRD